MASSSPAHPRLSEHQASQPRAGTVDAGTGPWSRSEGATMFLRVLTSIGAQHFDEGLRFIRDEVPPVLRQQHGYGESRAEILFADMP